MKKELDSLKDRVSKAEAASVAAGKKCDEESMKLRELQAQFRAADDIRQEAYTHFLSLKRQLFEKVCSRTSHVSFTYMEYKCLIH